MQIPIITSHRPSIGHHAIGALTATITLAIVGVAVWALAASAGGSGDAPANQSGAASLVPAAASVSVAPVALSVGLTVFVVSDYEGGPTISSWIDATVIDPDEHLRLVVQVAPPGVAYSDLASFLFVIGASRVVDLRPS